jgi:hypothetical protein
MSFPQGLFCGTLAEVKVRFASAKGKAIALFRETIPPKKMVRTLVAFNLFWGQFPFWKKDPLSSRRYV